MGKSCCICKQTFPVHPPLSPKAQKITEGTALLLPLTLCCTLWCIKPQLLQNRSSNGYSWTLGGDGSSQAVMPQRKRKDFSRKRLGGFSAHSWPTPNSQTPGINPQGASVGPGMLGTALLCTSLSSQGDLGCSPQHSTLQYASLSKEKPGSVDLFSSFTQGQAWQVAPECEVCFRFFH